MKKIEFWKENKKMKSVTEREEYQKIVSELGELSEEALNEIYDFMRYLKMKEKKKKDWKQTFTQALDAALEIGREKKITEKDIEEEIRKVREEQL